MTARTVLSALSATAAATATATSSAAAASARRFEASNFGWGERGASARCKTQFLVFEIYMKTVRGGFDSSRRMASSFDDESVFDFMSGGRSRDRFLLLAFSICKLICGLNLKLSQRRPGSYASCAQRVSGEVYLVTCGV